MDRQDMRIVTRADFDSIVCAVLLRDAMNITGPVKWVEPHEIQKRLVSIESGDIIANLPFHENCALWFDHHFSNRVERPFEGLYRIAPSAAGLVYEYYRDDLKHDFAELVAQADKIDAADLTAEEVRYPENYPYILLSMTITSQARGDEPYWERLIDLLQHQGIDAAMADPQVREKCRQVIKENRAYKKLLKENTRITGRVSITDFRSFDPPPAGNRFLVYSLFPQTVVNMKIRHDIEDRNTVIVNVGYNFLSPGCNVNVGAMLSRFEGGGHRTVGACSFPAGKTDDYLPQIIDLLVKNEPLPEPAGSG